MTYWKLKNSPLAQLVELLPYMQAVVGSIPTGTTKCSHGLVVMSPPFHGGHTGSNPVGSTDTLYEVVAAWAEWMLFRQTKVGE